MIPKQIIPGASNGIAATFSSGKYNEITYLSYATSNTVVLLAVGSLKVLQVLGGHEHDVKCIEWSRVGGKIASGSDNRVVIYSPVSEAKQFNDEAPRWEAVCTLQHQFEVLALSWLPARDFLVVGGASVQIWEFRKDLVEEYKAQLKRDKAAGNAIVVQTKQARQEYEAERLRQEERRKAALSRMVWQAPCTSPTAHIACSPDGRYFATAGRHDKVVKVWFARPGRVPEQDKENNASSANGHAASEADSSAPAHAEDSDEEDKEEKQEHISFGFLYLPHPRSVVSISWRPLKDAPNTKRGWFFQNVLLTQSRDHVVRLWLQSLNARRQQFHMCSVITAGPDSVVGWLSSLTGSDALTPDPFAPVQKEEERVIDDGQEHVHTSNNCNHNGIARYSNLALSSKLRTSVDWIMGVQRDGTVVIWKLRDVDSHTRQTPSLSIWNSMQILPLPEVSPHKILAFYDLRRGTVMKGPVRIPIEVSLYIYSVRGAISCWTFSIHGAANQIMSSILASRCFGHRGLIKEISASPSAPLVSTVDAANNLILWQSFDTTSVDPPFMLMDVSAMTPVSALAWSPEGNVCFISNGEGLFAYEMGVSLDGHPSTLPSRLPLALLEGSSELGLMLYTGVVSATSSTSASPSPPPEADAGVRPGAVCEHTLHVAAVSASGDRVFVWRVLLCGSSSPQGGDNAAGDHHRPKDTQVSSVLLATHVVTASEEKVTCAALVPNPTRQTTEVTPFAPFLLTGGADGMVRLWCLAEKGKEHKLRQMTSFQAHTSAAVAAIKVAYFGRIATASVGSTDVCVWELESATPSYKLEHKVTHPRATPAGADLTTSDLHFDWLSLANGKYVLAVGCGTEVKVYAQQRPKALQSFEVGWEVTDSFTALPQPVRALAWGKDGALVVGSANILFVFSKWRDVLHINQKDSGKDEKEDEAWITSFHRNSEYRCLPLYHPKVLLEFLMAGHFERAGFILGKVLQSLQARGEDKSRQVAIPPIMLEDIAGMQKGLVTNPQDEAEKNNVEGDEDDYVEPVREDEILDAQSAATKARFGTKQATMLSEYLTSVVLPGVTGPEQMYLLAIIDTYKQMQETQGALDERGVRFLLAVKIYAFMRRSMTSGKLNQTTLLQSHDFIWALHSYSQETILQACLPTDPEWPAARALGVGYWITNPTTLRGLVEKIAQAAFKVRKDPGDCALYYLALGKKGALSLVYRSVKDQKLVDFLGNDFTQPRWKTAAAKNAYQLQGKHRYELAAGFFLLAGSLKDAVTVLIQHTQDYQLALVISRLFEGENGPIYNYVLESLILPVALRNNDYPMASIAKWLLKKYEEALTILQQVAEVDTVDQADQHNPSILNFFKFLSGHTLLRNCPASTKKQDVLLRKAAYAYIQANVDFLALEQLEELKLTHPPVVASEPDEDDEEDAEKDAAGKDEAKEKEQEKKEEKEQEKEEEKEESSNDFGGGYNAFGGGYSSYGGFGDTSSSIGGSSSGGGGGDDWFDDFLGPPAPAASSSSFLSGSGSGDASEAAKEEAKKEPTKKYVNSTYPAVDTALMFHVVVQVLVEHIERSRKLGLWKAEAPSMYENLKMLSKKSGILENVIVVELIRYCASRQFIQQAWDLLLQFPDLPKHTLRFFATQQHSDKMHLALLLGAAHDIVGVATHITSHSLALTQARHISFLATEMHECIESASEQIPTEEAAIIHSSIYLAEFLSGWVTEEVQVLEALIKISNIKESTEAFKVGQQTLYQAEPEYMSDEEDEKPQNEPANVFWLTQLLHLLVLKKFIANIEDFLSGMQASRAPSSVKLLQHLVRWLRLLQGKLGHIPRNLQKPTQSAAAATLLQTFCDLVRNGKYTAPVKQLWAYIAKLEPLNDYASSIFVTDEKSHDVPLEYKIIFETESILFKDSDILQSFCINAADNQYVAVATTKGIREIDLRQVHVSDGEDDEGEGVGSGGEEYTSSGSALRHSGPDDLTKSKRMSISSKSTASLPSFKSKQNILKMAISQFTPSKELDHNIIVQWVESHPYYPYYLSGGIDGSVCLWQFGVPEALAAYRLPPHPWVMRCRFNPSGTKFGACDMAGNLALWKFNAPEDALRPFHSMQAHTKNTLDFAFLNNGSFIATVGISTESKRNVCLWDVLQPPHKAMVSAFTDHEAGATSVLYSPRHQLLVSGGKKGGIYVFDIRQNKLMESIKAHTLNTKSLSMDLMEQFAVSGSSDGNIKIWDLATLQCREVWDDVHRKQTFVRPTGVFKSPVSTYGVMAVGVVGDHIYSCGADKRLIKRKFSYGSI